MMQLNDRMKIPTEQAWNCMEYNNYLIFKNTKLLCRYETYSLTRHSEVNILLSRANIFSIAKSIST